MVNWRDAIKNAQEKIDNILDIRTESPAELTIETQPTLFGWASSQTGEQATPRANDSPENVSSPVTGVSPGQSSDPGSAVVVRNEPVLPPFVGHEDGAFDEAMTFVSSDLEVVNMNEERSEAEHEMVKSSFPSPSLNSNDLRRQNDWLNMQLNKLRVEKLELKKSNSKLNDSKRQATEEHDNLKAEATKLSTSLFEAVQERRKLREKLTFLEQKHNEIMKKEETQNAKIFSLEEALKTKEAELQELTANSSSAASKAQTLETDAKYWKDKCEALEITFHDHQAQYEKLVGIEKMAVSFENNYSGASQVANKQELLESQKKNELLLKEVQNLNQRIEELEMQQTALLSESVSAATNPLIERIDKLSVSLETSIGEREELQKKHKILMNRMPSLASESRMLKNMLFSLAEYFADLKLHFREDMNRVQISFGKYEAFILHQQTYFEKALLKAKTKPSTSESETQTSPVENNSPRKASTPEKETQVKESAPGIEFEKNTFVLEKMKEVVAMRESMKAEMDRVRQEAYTAEVVKRNAERRNQEYNELLIFYGEKIERIEELQADNDELRQLLREQALAHTNSASTAGK